MNIPHLSVVIIGRNEGKRIVDCITSVKTMNYPKEFIEIIYVDSNSQDNSLEHAKKLNVKTLKVNPERPSAAIGRNAGWQKAKSPFVLFLDGDTILHPDFVKKAIQHFLDPKVAVVWGHRRERHPNASVYQRVIDLDWIYPCGVSELCGGDVLVRYQALKEVGGYNSKLIAGEEPEMCQRIRKSGYTILHIDEQMTSHDLSIHTWSQYWRRCMRTGHAFAEVSNLLKRTSMPLYKKASRNNLLHAMALISLFFLGLSLMILYKKILFIYCCILVYFTLGMVSSIKMRWKSNSWFTLLLYGMHLQLRQIPIACGQLSYFFRHWLGKPRRLIEYK